MRKSDDPTPPEEADRLPGCPHPRETPVLFGQEPAEREFLAAARSGRLAHAWLITGPRGVGKATLAWRIARYLLADHTPPDLHVDPGSTTFRQLAALSHPGLFLCRRPWDDKAQRLRAEIPVDDVRALKTFFRFSSAAGSRRVAIIDSVDDLNTAAANALLKVLEEPPSGGVLLLVSHQPAGLLPTIRSRCRVLRCTPLPPEPLRAAVGTALGNAPESSPALAELASGSVAAAVELGTNDGLALYLRLLRLLASAPPVDRTHLLDLCSGLSGRDGAAHLGDMLRLTNLLLSRLARRAAGAPVAPVARDEDAIFARLAASPLQARLWAEAAANIGARSAHARAVHLDPAQVILDTFLQIDTVAREAARAAA
jgi:DNA polymerase III subunit delta'